MNIYRTRYDWLNLLSIIATLLMIAWVARALNAYNDEFFGWLAYAFGLAICVLLLFSALVPLTAKAYQVITGKHLNR